MDCRYNMQNTCPKCGSHNLHWGTYEVDGDYLNYDYTCVACGLEGKEFYNLSFDGHNFYDKEKQKWVDTNDELDPGSYVREDGVAVIVVKEK